MRSCLLHIGVHKTGTTAIQRAVGASRPRLLAQGILYPEVPGHEAKARGQHGLGVALGLPDAPIPGHFGLDDLIRHLETTPADTVVLSTETLSVPRIAPERSAKGGRVAEKIGRRTPKGPRPTGPSTLNGPHPVDDGIGDGLGPVLHRNIRVLNVRRMRRDAAAGIEDRIAETITRFTGSLGFVYVHLALVGGWVAANIGLLPGLAPFDPTFEIMATVASVEAIFLSTPVLVSQNRASAEADRRPDLDLPIGLLAEHEVTRLLTLTRAIADRLGIEEARDPRLGELEEDVAPEKVLDELEARSPPAS